MGILVEFTSNNPLIFILIFSLVVTIFLTYIYKKFTNQERIKEIKERQKHLQQRMKEAAGDKDKLMEIQKESLSLSGEQMKNSFKPMIITFIPIIIAIWWLRGLYMAAQVGDFIWHWGKDVWIFNTGFGWFEGYVFSSIIFSIILRKILKVH